MTVKENEIVESLHRFNVDPQDIDWFMKLIKEYAEEEHQAHCDDCDRIDPDNPPERDNEGYL